MSNDLIAAGLNIVITLVAVATLLWRYGHAHETRLREHLDQRFADETRAREQANLHLREMLTASDTDNQKIDHRLQQTQREVLELKAELPDRYVRREDYIRGQTLIESKIDALALRIENLQLQEAKKND